LLRLSALPLPKDEAEESSLLQTLRDQVHFLSSIRAVDTTGIEPLITIRDETNEGIAARTIGLDDLKPWLDLEKVDRNGTVRRRKIERERILSKDGEGKESRGNRGESKEWDPFLNKMDNNGVKHARRNRAGNWFVVKKAKPTNPKTDTDTDPTTSPSTASTSISSTPNPTTTPSSPSPSPKQTQLTPPKLEFQSNIPQPPPQPPQSIYETFTNLPSQWHRPTPKPKTDLPRIGEPLQISPRKPRVEGELPIDPTRYR
jgi:hypothetical protein